VKAVILAAGEGSRMRPFTEFRPKPMIQVVNIPILEHILDGLRLAGVRQVLMVTGRHAEIIEGYFGSGERMGMEIQYVRQESREGNARAALLAEPFVGDERFLLCFGDIMTPKRNYRALAERALADPRASFLATFEVADATQGGAVFVEGDRITKIIEKPSRELCTTNLTNAGIFFFGPEIFPLLAETKMSPRKEYEITDTVGALIENGGLLRPFRLEGYWSNVGCPTEVLSLNRIVLDYVTRELHNIGCSPTDAVFVGPNTEISPRAELRGPAIIGANCKIGKALVADYTCISDGTVIADGATIRRSGLFGDCRVGSGCVLDSALVGSEVVIESEVEIRGTPEQVAVVADHQVVSAFPPAA